MRNGEDWSAEDRARAEEAIGYRFRDGALLLSCFTHKSYANVHAEAQDNERLEFLGDAVLGLCVTEMLYLTTESAEGALTERRQNYVSRTALERACKRAGLMQFLRYSGGESNVGGKTPSNLFEAVVAGIYLDGGLHEAKAFLERTLTETHLHNYKSLLQQFTQLREREAPSYSVTEEGEQFACTVRALGRTGKGRGESKQAAERNAAKQLYEQLILEENRGEL